MPGAEVNVVAGQREARSPCLQCAGRPSCRRWLWGHESWEECGEGQRRGEGCGRSRGVHRCGKACRRHISVPWRQPMKFRGKKQEKEPSRRGSLGGTGGRQGTHRGRGLSVVGSPQIAGMFELPAAASWELSLEFGKKGKAHGSVGCRLRLAGAAQCSGGLAQSGAALTPWALLLFPCRRSQERVSVHPHRLHPSFDFGQLQTPQPRYLAEGTDW